MLTTVERHRLLEFGSAVRDPSVDARIELVLQHSDRPGPIVAILGGTARGQGQVLRSIVSTAAGTDAALCGEPLPADGTVCVAGSAWGAPADAMLALPTVAASRPCPQLGTLLVLQAPPTDRAALLPEVQQILQLADLVFYTIRIDRPADAHDTAFVRSNLYERRAILAITRCEVADDDDFAEALAAIQHHHGGTSWEKLLVAGAEGEQRQGISSVGHWWAMNGREAAQTARRHRHRHLLRDISAKAQEVLCSRLEEVERELRPLEAAQEESDALRHAVELRRRCDRALDAVMASAGDLYGQRVAELRATFPIFLDQQLDQVSWGTDFDPATVLTACQEHIDAWDAAVRKQVREQLLPAVECLREAASDFERCAAGLFDHTDNWPPTVRQGGVDPGAGVEPPRLGTVAPPDLTAAEALRPNLISIVSGFGGAILMHGVSAIFLGPLAVPVALAFGGVSGWSTKGSLDEATKRRLRSDFRNGCMGQFQLLLHALVNHYAQERERSRRELLARWAPFERALLFCRAASGGADTQRLDELGRRRAVLRELLADAGRLTAAGDHD